MSQKRQQITIFDRNILKARNLLPVSRNMFKSVIILANS